MLPMENAELKLEPCPFCGKKVNLLEGGITVQHPYSAHEGDECVLSGFTCDAELWESRASQPEAEKGFDYAKNFLEISLSKVPYAEFDDYYVEKVCGAGVFTTLFYLREFAKQKGK
jgi:hypothetical protein